MLLSTAEEGSRLQFTALRTKVMAKKNNIKKNDKLRQSDIETALVIGGACFVICIIVFLRFHRLKLIKVTDWFRIRAGDESTIHEYNDIRTVI